MMDIVMIPFHDSKKWFTEGFRTRDAHLAQHFCNDARVSRILVINRPTSFAEIVVKHRSWRTSRVAKNKRITSVYKSKNYEITKLNEKMYCLDIALPDFIKVAKEKKLWWQTAFNYNSVISIINDSIDILTMKNCILLLENPMAIGAVKGVNHNIFAFDAIDNWLYHPQMKTNHSVIKNNYSYIERKADVIFTVSKALTETFKDNNNVHWVPNGVDVEYFKPALREWNGSENITAGYVGKIQDRVDFNLVEECLKAYPEITFVFYGPIYSQKETISKLKKKYNNLKFVGDVHYTKLPAEMKKIDIALIPHKIDEFTNSMNPLKLYEYLAAGKPVLTTGIAGTNQLSKYVYVRNGKEFVKEIANIKHNILERKYDPILIANSIPSDCEWDYRSTTILNYIESTQNETQ